MVRFYKSYLGRMLLGLLLLIELEKTKTRMEIAQTLRADGLDPEGEQVIVTAVDLYLNAYPDESPDNADVLKGAIGQLTKKKQEDADLVDTIANYLKLPFGGYLGSGTMKLLRDAVLTPREQTELRKALKGAGKCACGYTFQHGELGVMMVEGDTAFMQCHKCRRPNYVRCDACENIVTLTGKVLHNIGRSVDCGCQAKRKAEAEAGGATLNAAPPLAATLRARRQILRNIPDGLLNVPPTFTPTPAPTPPPPLGAWPDEVDDEGF